ncbi:MAG: DUF2341 domain-containing protein [Bdellovibrionales bacterium]|nr:DUF2341 domain-containing protein [Bdellovibrionales bacterium]
MFVIHRIVKLNSTHNEQFKNSRGGCRNLIPFGLVFWTISLMTVGCTISGSILPINYGSSDIAIKPKLTVESPAVLDSIEYLWTPGEAWRYRDLITIGTSMISTERNNVVALVKLSTDSFDYSKAMIQGEDLRFYTKEGTLLSHQIGNWDNTGFSHIWVNIGQVKSGDLSKELFLYYGNVTAPAFSSNPWSTSFKGIFGFNSGISDSSTLAQDLVDTSTTVTAGFLNSGRSFTGANRLIANVLANDFGDRMSVSFWIKVTGAGNQSLFNISTSTGSTKVNIAIQEGKLFAAGSAKSQLMNRPNLIDDQWHQVVWSTGATSASVYLDGEKAITLDQGFNFSVSDLWSLGAGYASGPTVANYFYGTLDEVIFSQEEWSSDFVKFFYQNQIGLLDRIQSKESYENRPSYSLTFKLDQPRDVDTLISIADVQAPSGAGSIAFASSEVVVPAGQYDAKLNFTLLGASGTNPGDEVIVSLQEPSNKVDLGSGKVAMKVLDTNQYPTLKVQLYSDRTRGISNTASITPDTTVTLASDPQSQLEQVEVRIIQALTAEVVTEWFPINLGTAVRLNSLTLVNNLEYAYQFRGTLKNGQVVPLFCNAHKWKVSILNSPYASFSLPSVGTLPDRTLSTTTVNGSTYSISNPYSAKTLNVNGIVRWAAAGTSAVFLRAKDINLQTGVHIKADGEAPVGNTGGAGGSGGGAGSGGCSGSDGGSAGANGVGGALGWLSFSNYTQSFFFGKGGHSAGAHKAGANGAGGGGYGGGGCGGVSAGGGGGGGLLVITAESVQGNGLVTALGGHGSTDLTNIASGGGAGGGGGVVWLAFKNYNANLLPLVNGGFGRSSYGGYDGSLRIFQLHGDDSLTERSILETWTNDGVATTTNSNPVLPYPNNLPDTTTLANVSLTNTSLNSFQNNIWNPYSINTLNLTGTITYAPATPAAVFLRVNHIAFAPGSIVQANGTDHYSPGFLLNGGSGGSGGGGGGAGGGCTLLPGAPGGSGTHGARMSWVGEGGVGWERFYNPFGFEFGKGGDGGNGAGSSNKGYGTVSAGGGGGAGVRTACSSSGGGGGGGGLVVIVANNITGPGQIRALGGNGNTANGSSGGAGGGGVIWIATKNYSGELTATVSGGTMGNAAGGTGTAKIFQIGSDNTLTQRLFNESW